MTIATGALNIVLGAAYTSYGLITAVELKRNWRHLGFSHFGAAWIFMAFTCGPHHLFHGHHLLFEGRSGGALDLTAVFVGLPLGVAFLALRVEAFIGGRGDRFVAGTPWWMKAMPTLAAVYATALIAAVLRVGPLTGLPPTAYPNVLLFGIYMAIGYFLLRTQLRNRVPMGGWSVSGSSLTGVFPTCAIMHGVFILYGTTGLYAYDVHSFTIDWLGVPAGLYFLFVVRGLYRASIRDWNRDMVDMTPQPAAVG
jgi:hypothetical protein